MLLSNERRILRTYNLGQNKWEIWTTPPPISMRPKWLVFATSRLHHCFRGWGEKWDFIAPRYFVQDCNVEQNKWNRTTYHPSPPFQWCQNGAFLFLRAFIIALGEMGDYRSTLFCPRLQPICKHLPFLLLQAERVVCKSSLPIMFQNHALMCWISFLYWTVKPTGTKDRGIDQMHTC